MENTSYLSQLPLGQPPSITGKIPSGAAQPPRSGPAITPGATGQAAGRTESVFSVIVPKEPSYLSPDIHSINTLLTNGQLGKMWDGNAALAQKAKGEIERLKTAGQDASTWIQLRAKCASANAGILTELIRQKVPEDKLGTFLFEKGILPEGGFLKGTAVGSKERNISLGDYLVKTYGKNNVLDFYNKNVFSVLEKQIKGFEQELGKRDLSIERRDEILESLIKNYWISDKALDSFFKKNNVDTTCFQDPALIALLRRERKDISGPYVPAEAPPTRGPHPGAVGVTAKTQQAAHSLPHMAPQHPPTAAPLPVEKPPVKTPDQAKAQIARAQNKRSVQPLTYKSSKTIEDEGGILLTEDKNKTTDDFNGIAAVYHPEEGGYRLHLCPGGGYAEFDEKMLKKLMEEAVETIVKKGITITSIESNIGRHPGGTMAEFQKWQTKHNPAPQEQYPSQPAPTLASAIPTAPVTQTERSFRLADITGAYNPVYAPRANYQNLEGYFQTGDYKRHAATARVYYNAQQLAQADALKIVWQREPTNIGAEHLYDETKCQEQLGYRHGVYYDGNVKSDGKPFSAAPNTACIYSETYLWNPPGGQQKSEIACFSVPAPALDSKDQPHYDYYMSSGKLDEAKYEQEIAFLFGTIEKGVRENNSTAFGNKGPKNAFKRVIVPRFGQGAFLGALSAADQARANHIFDTQYTAFKKRMADLKIPIYQSEYSPQPSIDEKGGKVYGDIVQVAQTGDFVVNAWDPHSAPGNGNDSDRSFDGAMGKASGILLTQTAWLNPHLRKPESLSPVGQSAIPQQAPPPPHPQQPPIQQYAPPPPVTAQQPGTVGKTATPAVGIREKATWIEEKSKEWQKNADGKNATANATLLSTLIQDKNITDESLCVFLNRIKINHRGYIFGKKVGSQGEEVRTLLSQQRKNISHTEKTENGTLISTFFVPPPSAKPQTKL